MKLTKYLAVLCCGTLFAACENPIQDDLNVDNPENYTRIYTVNAVDDASKNTLSFPLERDTSLMVYANLSGIRNPGCDVTVKFRVAPELVDTYNQKHQSNYPMMLDGSYTIENLEAVIPNGKYISSPIRIAINSQAFGRLPAAGTDRECDTRPGRQRIVADGLPAHQRLLHRKSVPEIRQERLVDRRVLDAGG